MAINPIDQVFNRWLLDREFRARMDENPEETLAGYDLSDADRQKLSRLSRKVRRQAKSKKIAVKVVCQESSSVHVNIHHRIPRSSHCFSLN